MLTPLMKTLIRKVFKHMLLTKSLPFNLNRKSLKLEPCSFKRLIFVHFIGVAFLVRICFMGVQIVRHIRRLKNESIKEAVILASYEFCSLFCFLIAVNTIINRDRYVYFFNIFINWGTRWRDLHCEDPNFKKTDFNVGTKIFHFIVKYYSVTVFCTCLFMNLENLYSVRNFCSELQLCRDSILFHLFVISFNSLLDMTCYGYLLFFLVIHLTYTGTTAKRFAFQCDQILHGDISSYETMSARESRIFNYRSEQLLNQEFSHCMSPVMLPTFVTSLVGTIVCCCIITLYLFTGLGVVIFSILLVSNIALLILVRVGFHSSSLIFTKSVLYVRVSKLRPGGKGSASDWKSCKPLKVKVRGFLYFERYTGLRIYGMILYLVMKISTTM